jgi:hypothetical protein
VILFTILGLFFKLFHNSGPAPTVPVKFDAGDTAWMIVTTMIIMMTLRLRFFDDWNGGVKKKC